MVVIRIGATRVKEALAWICHTGHQISTDTQHPHPGIPTILLLHLITHKKGIIRHLPGPTETERYFKGQVGHPKDLMALWLREIQVKDHNIRR